MANTRRQAPRQPSLRRLVFRVPTQKDGLTYGYLRAVEPDGTLTLYFPQIGSLGSGYRPDDFVNYQEVARG